MRWLAAALVVLAITAGGRDRPHWSPETADAALILFAHVAAGGFHT